MPVTSNPRPQPKQYRSSGWAWPLLVNVQVQKEKKSSPSKSKSSPTKHASAKPSMRDLRRSRDLTHLREEQSEPTSPLQSPGSPGDGSTSGHRAEATEICDECTDVEHDMEGLREAPAEQNKPEKHDDSLPRHVLDEKHPAQGNHTSSEIPKVQETTLELENVRDEHVNDAADTTRMPAKVTGEVKTQPEIQYKKDSRYVPPVAESFNGSETQDEEGYEESISSIAAQEGSKDEPEAQTGEHDMDVREKDILEETNTVVPPTLQQPERFPTAHTGVLPEKFPTFLKTDELPEPTTTSDTNATGPKEILSPGEQHLNSIQAERTKSEQPQTASEPAIPEEGQSSTNEQPPFIPTGGKKIDGPKTISEPASSKEPLPLDDENSPSTPAKRKKPDQPRTIPIIKIQRPSHSGISEADDGHVPAAPLPTPEPYVVDVILAEGRYVPKSLPLQKRHREERRVIKRIAPQDRNKIVQDIATDMAALEPDPSNTKVSKPNLAIPAKPRVKKRMRVRGKFVRSPVLKVLLGRQLAGPAKEALRLSALGDTVPTIPDVTHAYSAVPHSKVLELENRDFALSTSQADDAGPSNEGNSSSHRYAIGEPSVHPAAIDQSNLETIDSSSTPESQQVWFGRRYQADFIASLPGIKHICRMLQQS